MKTITVQLTGVRPLIMSNHQTVQLSNPFAVESRRVNSLVKSARKKGDENKLAELEQTASRNDWEASAYYDKSENVFFLPDTVICACIRAGAAAARKGKDIDRAVIVNETFAPICDVPQHKTLDGYYSDSRFVLSCQAKIPPKTGALIWKTRCMMPTGWTLKFSCDFDENTIAEKSLLEAIEAAGKVCGIGGWRPKFGRFTVSVM